MCGDTGSTVFHVEILGVLVGKITGYSWIRLGMKIEVLSLDLLSSSLEIILFIELL